VAGDTFVEARQWEHGETIVELRRGTIECEVAPRAGRAPFRVVAGEVAVEVVGTRFSVSRRDRVEVRVTRGRVAVIAAGGRTIIDAGGRWIEGEQAGLAPEEAELEVDAAAGDDEAILIEPAPDDPPRAAAGSRRATRPEKADGDFAAARRLESTDPEGARKAYRALASRRDRWAALALYALAELEASEASRGRAAQALEALDEYAKRFPRGTHAEDAAWLRVQVLLAAGRRDEAREAARAYLDRFPDGTYRGPAGRAAGGR
jgi:tetratricopeptide (TPR) repeat protein